MDVPTYISRIFFLSQNPIKYLNIDAVYSDTTPQYFSPECVEPGEYVTVTLRVAKGNADRVWVCQTYSQTLMRLDKERSEESVRFDFYTGKLRCSEDKINYYFEIICDGREYYYNLQGVTKDRNSAYDFSVLPGFHTPDWAKGAVMYQIYVDRFFSGDSSNDVVNNEYCYLGVKAKKINDWYAPLENLDVCNFYGGDLKGVAEKLHYLKDLGVEAIYLNPIFVSPSNHKYDIQDYDHIDPHYGVIVNDGGDTLPDFATDNTHASKYMLRTTNKENLEASDSFFASVVEQAHALGIKVILDGVFNHCGAFNKWLDREGFYEKNGYPVGAYKSKDSKYHNYFKWHDDTLWPNNDSYDGWWAHSNHPKLNYEQSPELEDYIMQIAQKWLKPPYNCDGWRLDVAADLGFSREYNMKFWRMFRNAVKQINPDAIIIAEHYGDPQPWLQGDQWDTIMNYDAFMEPITWFLTGMEKHSEKYDEGMYNNSSAFENAMRYYGSRFNYQSMYVAMNELSNHDHSRFLTRTSKKVGRLHTNGSADADTGCNIGIMREAITFQLTWPGAPTIYYGDEAGLTGWTDPDNRRTFPWGKENLDILLYYKQLISIHRSRKVFYTGCADYLYMNYGIICFGRWNKNDRVVVLINNNDTEREITVPIWRLGAEDGETFINLICSGLNGWHCDATEYCVVDGCIHVTLNPFGSTVIALAKDYE